MLILLRFALAIGILYLPTVIVAENFPVTVKSCHHTLTFHEPPKRAVIHDINMAEMAFILHLQPAIVGITGISGWYKPKQAFEEARGIIPELAPKHPTLEQLLSVSPDFFFAGWNYGMQVGGDVTPDLLARYGIQTLVLSESCSHMDAYPPRASMELLYQDILKLGVIFGKQELAQRQVEVWRATLNEITNRIGQRTLLQQVFVYDSGTDKPFSSGKYAMPTAIIEAAGGQNILADMPMSWGTVSWETVAIRQPQLIILLDYPANGSEAMLRRFLENHPLMSLTPAVRQHRYLALPYEALTPGPANIDTIKTLARALYPDAFLL